MTRDYATDTQRWQAVVDKDTAAAHAFYYGVKTTGIFCIAGCASRLPKRENVLFLDTADNAVEAGFRPCKRCHPQDTAHADIASNRIVRACRAMEQAEDSPSLEELAEEAELSPQHFQKLFKEHVGISPKKYAQAIRDTKVRTALEKGESVTRAIMDAGYGSASRFYEKSKQTLGMSARTYSKGGAGLLIHYASGTTFLGTILAAFTDKGVCSIEFGESEDALVQSLTARFDQADIQPGGRDLKKQIARISDFIRSPEKRLDLPLDIQGTAFQQQVWQALKDIPAGETRTYSEVAESLGIPGSVRAVATACARNRLAVVVPCHRVLRKDGSLGGYYWGLEKKTALLENEKKGMERK